MTPFISRAARAAKGNDRRGDYCRSAAHSLGDRAGSEVMSRIAAPMIGGMITAPLLSLFIIPAAYKLIWLRRHKPETAVGEDDRGVNT
jgi:hypothetical protein